MNKGAIKMIRFIPVNKIIVERLDPYYYDISMQLEQVYDDFEGYRLLTDLCDEINDGARKAVNFAEQGVPYLRVSNLTPSGIDITDAKFLLTTDGVEKKAIVHSGDILLSKIAAIWKFAVVDRALDGAVISPDLIKMRPKNKRAREVLLTFLDSDLGRFSFAQVVTQTVIPKISLKQVRYIKVPLSFWYACVNKQKEQSLDWQTLRTRLQMYYNCYPSRSFWELPEEWWVRSRLTSERLDVKYYQYLYSPWNEIFEECLEREHWVPLVEVANVISKTVSPMEYREQVVHYIGLKNVNNYHLLVESAEQELFDKVRSRARFRVKEGDLLLGVVGSSIGEEDQTLAMVPHKYDGALASSVFAVIRPLQISPYYLLWSLQHPLVRFQMKMQSYGVTQQLLSNRSLMDIYVPVLSEEAVVEIEGILKAYMGGL